MNKNNTVHIAWVICTIKSCSCHDKEAAQACYSTVSDKLLKIHLINFNMHLYRALFSLFFTVFNIEFTGWLVKWVESAS